MDPSCLVCLGGEDFLLPKARKEQKAEQVDVLTEKLKKAIHQLQTAHREHMVEKASKAAGAKRK